MYKLVRPLFFKLEPEAAHYSITSGLRRILKIWGMKKLFKSQFEVVDKRLEREVFGLKFKNPIGLAAGFDKNAEFIEEMSTLGFGFIEIGTLTPRPQPGNEAPRMFRLKQDEALINRMGFNNKGVDVAATRLKHLKERNGVLVGGNIGKNKDTPNEKALEDYLYSFKALFEVVDYFVVNVSSPNTPGLRDLQEKGPLLEILQTLQEENMRKQAPKPILLKIAPDLTNGQLDDIIEIVLESKIAGVIATNTTISREYLKSSPQLTKQMGGLSGKPLTKRSTEVIRYLTTQSQHAFPVIGVGGIHTPEDAMEKLEAGASLVQLYTGFIYEGPSLIKRIAKRILSQ